MAQLLLLPLLIICSWIALEHPQPFESIWSQIGWLIAAIMFSIGLMLPKDEVAEVMRRPWNVVLGVSLQYAIMPLLAWAAAGLFGLDGPTRTGVILVGCVPGAMASNVLTHNARGNTSFSVSLTTMATLCSPVVVPLALGLFLSEKVSQQPMAMAWKLTTQVVAPVIAGYFTQRLLSRHEKTIRHWAPLAANAIILLVIAMVVAKNRDRLVQASLLVLPPLLLINLLGYQLGYLAGWAVRFPEGMRRALTIEIGMQNAGVGAALAASFFSSEAAVAPAIYTFGCMLTGTLLAQIWSFFPPAEGNAEETRD
ncbi:MAG: bile acid:sodium symporter family protein [Pirellulaceae bacterium]|nr:bile acid:sodium symporter family protein [Pirellulaceae bacterium]MDP7017397.1 bile acid:sodium symporter family protein [Pirellulaceae bacterium]